MALVWQLRQSGQNDKEYSLAFVPELFTFVPELFTFVPELFMIVDSSLYLLPEAKLDYERVSQHILRIRTTDDGRPPYTLEQEVLVNVTDVNEPPGHIVIAAKGVRK